MPAISERFVRKVIKAGAVVFNIFAEPQFTVLSEAATISNLRRHAKPRRFSDQLHEIGSR